MRAEKLKNQRKTNKRFRRSICALLFAVGLAATGISLAYFTSSDNVTNRLTADQDYSMLRIDLTEPKWDATGETEAKETVPGMEIDKDPYVTNYLPTNVYIRLKVDFYSNGTAVEVDEESRVEILDYYYNGITESQVKDTTTAYSRFLSAVYYNGDNKNNHLLIKNDNGRLESSNPYFYYCDGYFYYLDYDGNTPASTLKGMQYMEKTTVPLFTTIKLPIFKDEYNDLFAKGFKIEVTAQAVDVAEFTSNSISDMSDIENIFNEKFNSNN